MRRWSAAAMLVFSSATNLARMSLMAPYRSCWLQRFDQGVVSRRDGVDGGRGQVGGIARHGERRRRGTGGGVAGEDPSPEFMDMVMKVDSFKSELGELQAAVGDLAGLLVWVGARRS